MNFIFDLLARLLSTNDVAVLVAQLDKLSARLVAAEKAQLARAGRIDEAIEELTRDRDQARAEAERASRVAANIGTLIA